MSKSRCGRIKYIKVYQDNTEEVIKFLEGLNLNYDFILNVDGRLITAKSKSTHREQTRCLCAVNENFVVCDGASIFALDVDEFEEQYGSLKLMWEEHDVY